MSFIDSSGGNGILHVRAAGDGIFGYGSDEFHCRWRAARLSATARIIRGLEVLEAWRQRAQGRRILREMDERMLKDIGISSRDATREGQKPFWLP